MKEASVMREVIFGSDFHDKVEFRIHEHRKTRSLNVYVEEEVKMLSGKNNVDKPLEDLPAFASQKHLSGNSISR